MSGQRHRLKAAPFKDLAGRPAVFFRSKKRSKRTVFANRTMASTWGESKRAISGPFLTPKLKSLSSIPLRKMMI
jgi:hypothetical protein